ncbi:MAG: two-component system, NtrC family, response regulator GlrR [Acidobacteriota bacterium]|jgi:DNA-binding NtrC family response regulator|nr:two-component system, NtrC family, response regulator GlrR [Acidobacteriota bacterium]
MTLPQILLIDDQCGWQLDARANICHLFGLVDASADRSVDVEIHDPVAEVTVSSGQMRTSGRIVNSLEVCERAVLAGGADRWALVLLDLRFVSGPLRGDGGQPAGVAGDDRFGLEVLSSISKRFPDLPVIIMSGLRRDVHIEEALRLHASDFIDRNLDDFDASPMSGREIMRDRLFKHGLLEDSRGIVIGCSTELRYALRAARRASRGRTTLLVGESGTGKELVARYLHDLSERARFPFLAHDLQSPESLEESVLFGIEGGTATGVSARTGLFERANRGTLFLDEIAEIDPRLQAKLLRVLETRRVLRLGGDREQEIDVHVVVATNKDLPRYVRENRFRADLWQRVNAFEISLPPLRARQSDIPTLAQALLDRLCAEHRLRRRELTWDAAELLSSHSWPGNVRELRNVLDRAVRNFPDVERVVPAHLPLAGDDSAHTVVPVALPGNDLASVTREAEKTAHHLSRVAGSSHEDLRGRLETIQEHNLTVMCEYLEKCLAVTRKPAGGINITAAAKLMTGNPALTRTQAASLFKRCLAAPELIRNRILPLYPSVAESWCEAVHTRPVGGKVAGEEL